MIIIIWIEKVLFNFSAVIWRVFVDHWKDNLNVYISYGIYSKLAVNRIALEANENLLCTVHEYGTVKLSSVKLIKRENDWILHLWRVFRQGA